MHAIDGEVRLTLLERVSDGWHLRFKCQLADDFWEVVDNIKLAIPYSARRWLSDDKSWWIQDNYLSFIASMFQNYQEMHRAASYTSHTSHTSSKRQDTTPEPVRASYATLHLLPDAPPEVVKAAYRACATLHHPDHGGSHERMKQINLAFESAYQWATQHRKKSA